MTKTVNVKTGLTGAEKKLAKNFGGVVAEQQDSGRWHSRFKGNDVYMPSYGGSLIMTFCGAADNTALRSAQELLRLTALNAESGRLFLVGTKSESPERTQMQDELSNRGFHSVRLPSRKR